MCLSRLHSSPVGVFLNWVKWIVKMHWGRGAAAVPAFEVIDYQRLGLYNRPMVVPRFWGTLHWVCSLVVHEQPWDGLNNAFAVPCTFPLASPIVPSSRRLLTLHHQSLTLPLSRTPLHIPRFERKCLLLRNFQVELICLLHPSWPTTWISMAGDTTDCSIFTEIGHVTTGQSRRLCHRPSAY